MTRGALAMMIPGPPPGIYAEDGAAASDQPTPNAPDLPPTDLPGAEAQSLGALGGGELARRADPIRAAVCGLANGKAREAGRHDGTLARSRRAGAAAALGRDTALHQSEQRPGAGILCGRYH